MQVLTNSTLITLLILATGISGCRSKAFTGGKNEQLPPHTDDGIYLPSKDGKKNEKIFSGVYDVTVTGRNDPNKIRCEGTVTIDAYEEGNIINGRIPCEKALGTKDIQIGDGKARETIGLSMEESRSKNLDTRITRIKQYGEAEYIPYRPNLIGPLIQSPTAYASVDSVDAFTVRLKTEDPKKPIEEGSGTIHVKMLEINQTFKPRNYPTAFDNVVRYQLNATGFEGLSDKSKANIYENYEYRWSVAPMRLLSIHIEGPVKDFQTSEFRGIVGNILTFPGGIVIDMQLNKLN